MGNGQRGNYDKREVMKRNDDRLQRFRALYHCGDAHIADENKRGFIYFCSIIYISSSREKERNYRKGQEKSHEKCAEISKLYRPENWIVPLSPLLA